ncbi:FAD-binding oxidoreductase [Nocardioides panacisoli]|uniref:FAD-binding oxidoreductase n=1 Tax=Nocardioides panacisoli TaxID=627624 RepID=A0ABP7IIW1_9ACTN
MTFSGTTLSPDQPGYDEARRLFNGMIDRRPSRILRCGSTADVAAAVADCRALGEPFSVLGAGHGVTGSALIDGAVCIDLRGLDRVEVDPAAAAARVGGGATWGLVDAATQELGLAVTGGRVPSTGVGGLALGSGSGWLERKLGFTCDNLLSAEVVTASGDIVTASESENADLFWAIRGGGGNFGIVTEFVLKLHPIGPVVLGGMLLYPGFMAADVTRNWRDFILTAPDEAGGGVALITAPPEDFVPEPARGQPCVGVIVVYAGDPEKGREVMAPVIEFGPPAVDLVQPMPYVAVQRLLEPPNPPGMRNYWSGDFLAELPDEAVDAWVGSAFPPASPMTQMILVAGGGAVARVEEGATAFGNRDAPFNLHHLSMWPPDPSLDQANIEKTRSVAAAMKPWTTGSVYLNFIGDEGLHRVASAFAPDTYARLRAIKKQWDPDNVFRFNQNIPPAD